MSFTGRKERITFSANPEDRKRSVQLRSRFRLSRKRGEHLLLPLLFLYTLSPALTRARNGSLMSIGQEENNT